MVEQILFFLLYIVLIAVVAYALIWFARSFLPIPAKDPVAGIIGLLAFVVVILVAIHLFTGHRAW